tara:strand:+ start:81 stop:317 length:237 start_codon:yes stop_codon:yes gene_type:complete
MKNQTVYEYMTEHKLLEHMLNACENDEQRNATIAYAKDIAAKLDPLINSTRKACETEEGRKELLDSLTILNSENQDAN